MWPLIARWFLTLAPGVFFADIMTWLGDMFKVKKDANGNYPVWFIAALVLGFAFVMAAVVYFFFSKGKGKNKKYSFVLAGAAAGCWLLDCWLFPGDPGYSQAVILIVLTTGAAVQTTVNSTYIPQYFSYVAATQLTSVRITYQGGGVLLDLDAAGLNSVRGARQVGNITNGTMINLANGFIPNKNLIWEFVNSAAQTPTIYIGAEERADKSRAGDMVLTATKAAVLANSGTEFDDFEYLAMPSLGATDVINVSFRDGLVQPFNRVDLQMLLQRVQSQVNTPDYNISNIPYPTRKIKKVNVTAAAAFTAYVQKWQRVGEILEAQLQ